MEAEVAAVMSQRRLQYSRVQQRIHANEQPDT